MLMTVTLSLTYLLVKNFGFEKIKVVKNEILSSDVDADGKVRFLVRQYTVCSGVSLTN